MRSKRHSDEGMATSSPRICQNQLHKRTDYMELNEIVRDIPTITDVIVLSVSATPQATPIPSQASRF